MGVEHSSGSQTLCYINADHQEECFRNEFEMHNIFEMGFDILQKDAGLVEGLQYAHEHGGQVDEEHAAALEEYMSRHHSGEPHDIEALQRHLTQAQILTEPHAPIHDALRHAGLMTPVEEHHEDDDLHFKTEHYHKASHHGDADGHDSPYRHYEHGDSAHDVLTHHHEKQVEAQHHAIQEDFAHRLMDHKRQQTGHEYRLFGHTMVSYEQLQTHVRHNQCVQVVAEHMYHTESSSKWLCQKNLDEFWSGDCIYMDPHIQVCDEQGISLFLGKCIKEQGFQICPSDPVVVEHLKTEEHVPDGCYRNAHGALMCESDLYHAFDHGSCFQVEHKFICEEDMDHITDAMCVDIGSYNVCGLDLHNLFHGEEVRMHDGHVLHADFATPKHDHHSALCRKHEGIEFCLENILDLYQPPHDCVMFAGEWLCQDEMVHAWKEGCVEVNGHRICGPTMVDAVLQSCVEIDHDWVCPTAVGTKHGGYHNN